MVSLIQYGDLNCIQLQKALTHQVLQSARGRHDDIDTIPKSLNLPVLRYSTKNGGDPKVHSGSQWLERIGDLCG